mmetsp:Transcript_1346/g.3902  ORF Transcript_1346/g.3902 Transcript_1346/m.3902 type:complete len:212 (+) Transcript_1346:2026-2661(+)
MSSAMGSAPDESTKISGTVHTLSLKTASKLNDGGSKNSLPSFPKITSCKPLIVWSVRRASNTRLFSKAVIWSRTPLGHFTLMGSSESKTRCHASMSSMNRSLKPTQGPLFKSASSEMRAQLTSVSQAALGLGRMLAPVVPPTNSKAFSSWSSSESTSMDLKVKSNEYKSLCFSNNESQTFWKTSSMNRSWRACRRRCKLRSGLSAVLMARR